jgi:hypothetical protein
MVYRCVFTSYTLVVDEKVDGDVVGILGIFYVVRVYKWISRILSPRVVFRVSVVLVLVDFSILTNSRVGKG